MGITDDEESMYIYSVTVTHESVSLPIAGILNWSSFGLNNTYSNSLYVERDIVENMIEKHKKTEDRKLYVIGVNYDKYYENELPKDFDGEVNRVFEDSVQKMFIQLHKNYLIWDIMLIMNLSIVKQLIEELYH